ncbi:MAG: ATP-binding protein [Deltaproteobacteria bacterium]|nr:ATP-binding protein [Deltaproteobacteria bacterium]
MSDIKKVSRGSRSLFEDILVKRAATHKDCLAFEQELFDAIPLPAFFQDADGHYFGVNRALADFLGVERKILLEQGVYPFLLPSLAEECRQKDAELLAGGGRDFFEGLVAGRDGHDQSVLFTRSTVHDRKGRVLGLVVTLFDLSALKEAQRNLGEIESQKQAILDAFPGTLALLDCDLQVIWSNRDNKKEDVSCMASKARSCHEFLHGRKAPCVDCAVRRSILSGQIESGIHETEIDADSGANNFFDVVAAPVKDASGKVTSVVAISRDITKKMQLEKQVRHSQKMEAIGSLAGGIAHDFNNVLTPIIGHAEIIRFRLRQSGQQDQELEKYIGEILTAAKRAKSLVGQILTFARSQEQNRVALYVHPIVKEVMSLIKVALPSTIEIHQEIDTNCGQVLMDPVQLHQVLMNLCTNSFHAMEGRVGTLTVRLAKGEVDQDGREWLVISVADTGSGIDPAVLPRIFEPYFTTKDKSRGTGMGLAMVHGIVGGYGGRVEVQSEVGVGTTFYVYLPVAASQSSPVESVLAVPLPARGKEHILVVDDEEQVLNIITSMLTGLGYRVTSKSSSQEALLLFMEIRDDFDLLITDYIMPLLTGVDLCAQIKKIRPDMPVILCTGYSEQIGEEVLKRAGVDEYFLKPVTLQGLAQVVRRVIDGKT